MNKLLIVALLMCTFISCNRALIVSADRVVVETEGVFIADGRFIVFYPIEGTRVQSEDEILKLINNEVGFFLGGLGHLNMYAGAHKLFGGSIMLGNDTENPCIEKQFETGYATITTFGKLKRFGDSKSFELFSNCMSINGLYYRLDAMNVYDIVMN